jgi:hypothetical protein
MLSLLMQQATRLACAKDSHHAFFILLVTLPSFHASIPRLFTPGSVGHRDFYGDVALEQSCSLTSVHSARLHAHTFTHGPSLGCSFTLGRIEQELIARTRSSDRAAMSRHLLFSNDDESKPRVHKNSRILDSAPLAHLTVTLRRN